MMNPSRLFRLGMLLMVCGLVLGTSCARGPAKTLVSGGYSVFGSAPDMGLRIDYFLFWAALSLSTVLLYIALDASGAVSSAFSAALIASG